MDRRHFIKNTGLLTGGLAVAGQSAVAYGFAAN
ncbi:MAG: twin-arginine translocation signal domain-containing protein, partial [Segetibacter sp.]